MDRRKDGQGNLFEKMKTVERVNINTPYPKMDALRFYFLFNSITVLSGRYVDDNERLCAMEPVHGREDSASSEARTR